MTSLLQGTDFKLANHPCAILQLFSHRFIDDVRELYVNKRGKKSKKKKRFRGPFPIPIRQNQSLARNLPSWSCSVRCSCRSKEQKQRENAEGSELCERKKTKSERKSARKPECKLRLGEGQRHSVFLARHAGVSARLISSGEIRPRHKFGEIDKTLLEFFVSLFQSEAMTYFSLPLLSPPLRAPLCASGIRFEGEGGDCASKRLGRSNLFQEPSWLDKSGDVVTGEQQARSPKKGLTDVASARRRVVCAEVTRH